jgi:hypothetical protein
MSYRVGFLLRNSPMGARYNIYVYNITLLVERDDGFVTVGEQHNRATVAVLAL